MFLYYVIQSYRLEKKVCLYKAQIYTPCNLIINKKKNKGLLPSNLMQDPSRYLWRQWHDMLPSWHCLNNWNNSQHTTKHSFHYYLEQSTFSLSVLWILVGYSLIQQSFQFTIIKFRNWCMLQKHIALKTITKANIMVSNNKWQ